MGFKTQYDRKDVKTAEEKPEKGTMVETAGYMTAEQRITSLINAGQRLTDYRKAHYDIQDGEEIPPDIQPDPTRAGNFDLADATMLKSQTTHNLTQAAKEQLKLDAQKRQEALQQTSENKTE